MSEGLARSKARAHVIDALESTNKAYMELERHEALVFAEERVEFVKAREQLRRLRQMLQSTEEN